MTPFGSKKIPLGTRACVRYLDTNKLHILVRVRPRRRGYRSITHFEVFSQNPRARQVALVRPAHKRPVLSLGVGPGGNARWWPPLGCDVVIPRGQDLWVRVSSPGRRRDWPLSRLKTLPL